LSGVSIGHGAVIGAGSLISEVRLHFLLSLGIRQNSFGCDLPLLKSSNY
jgi:acetyltransferase-like isoleucine patch superfamily enzyme